MWSSWLFPAPGGTNPPPRSDIARPPAFFSGRGSARPSAPNAAWNRFAPHRGPPMHQPPPRPPVPPTPNPQSLRPFPRPPPPRPPPYPPPNPRSRPPAPVLQPMPRPRPSYPRNPNPNPNPIGEGRGRVRVEAKAGRGIRVAATHGSSSGIAAVVRERSRGRVSPVQRSRWDEEKEEEGEVGEEWEEAKGENNKRGTRRGTRGKGKVIGKRKNAPELIDLTEESEGKGKDRARSVGTGKNKSVGKSETACSANEVKVLIDGQNVAFYGNWATERGKSRSSFRWEYIYAVVNRCVAAGVKPVVVLKPFGLSYPAPENLTKYIEYVSPADNRRDQDDTALLSMAISFKCRYISNDNFRNFKLDRENEKSRSSVISKYLKQHQDERQIYFMISDNKFVPTSDNGAFLLRDKRGGQPPKPLALPPTTRRQTRRPSPPSTPKRATKRKRADSGDDVQDRAKRPRRRDEKNGDPKEKRPKARLPRETRKNPRDAAPPATRRTQRRPAYFGGADSRSTTQRSTASSRTVIENRKRTTEGGPSDARTKPRQNKSAGATIIENWKRTAERIPSDTRRKPPEKSSSSSAAVSDNRKRTTESRPSDARTKPRQNKSAGATIIENWKRTAERRPSDTRAKPPKEASSAAAIENRERATEGRPSNAGTKSRQNKTAGATIIENWKKMAEDKPSDAGRKRRQETAPSTTVQPKKKRKRVRGKKKKVEQSPVGDRKRARRSPQHAKSKEQTIPRAGTRPGGTVTSPAASEQKKRMLKKELKKLKAKIAEAETVRVQTDDPSKKASRGASKPLPITSFSGLHEAGWNGHDFYFKCPMCNQGFLNFFLCAEHMIMKAEHLPMEKSLTALDLYDLTTTRAHPARETYHGDQIRRVHILDPLHKFSGMRYICPQRGCHMGTRGWKTLMKHWTDTDHGMGVEALRNAQLKRICARPGWHGYPYSNVDLYDKTVPIRLTELEELEKADMRTRSQSNGPDIRVFARRKIFAFGKGSTKCIGRVLMVFPGNSRLICTNGFSVQKPLGASKRSPDRETTVLRELVDESGYSVEQDTSSKNSRKEKVPARRSSGNRSRVERRGAGGEKAEGISVKRTTEVNDDDIEISDDSSSGSELELEYEESRLDERAEVSTSERNRGEGRTEDVASKSEGIRPAEAKNPKETVDDKPKTSEEIVILDSEDEDVEEEEKSEGSKERKVENNEAKAAEEAPKLVEVEAKEELTPNKEPVAKASAQGVALGSTDEEKKVTENIELSLDLSQSGTEPSEVVVDLDQKIAELSYLHMI